MAELDGYTYLNVVSGQILTSSAANGLLAIDRSSSVPTTRVSRIQVSSDLFVLGGQATFASGASVALSGDELRIQTNSAYFSRPYAMKFHSTSVRPQTADSTSKIFFTQNSNSLELLSKNNDQSISTFDNFFTDQNELSFQVQSQYIDFSAERLELRDATNPRFSLFAESLDISSQDEKGFLNGITSAQISSGDIGQYYFCYNFSSGLQNVYVDSNTNFAEFTIPTSYTHYRRLTDRLEVD